MTAPVRQLPCHLTASPAGALLGLIAIELLLLSRRCGILT